MTTLRIDGGTVVTMSHKGIIRNGTVVVENGTQTINCTVNAYYYDATATYLMGTQNVTDLNPCNNATLTFNWDVSGLPEEAIYTLKANATCPCGASDEFVYGQVKIRRLGDVSGDGVIDIGDVKKVKLAYSGLLNPFADLNGDCVVDIGDVKKVKLAFSGIL